jgi:SAM-dependent methyltransferase
LIPNEKSRLGGKYSYAEWAHVIGIFQTLICQHRQQQSANQILDIGCGTGILAIAAEPFVQDGGRYLGIDIGDSEIKFCREHYAKAHFEFLHLDVSNPEYAPDQTNKHVPWPLANESFDVVTALSVWTHLDEADARFYLGEVCRVMKPNGRAIVTFFILDEEYEKNFSGDTQGMGRFHRTPKSTWIFDQISYGSQDFRHPKWADVPESAIAIKKSGLDRMLADVGLSVMEQHAGNWKEVPGLYFQDVVILQRVEKLV